MDLELGFYKKSTVGIDKFLLFFAFFVAAFCSYGFLCDFYLFVWRWGIFTVLATYGLL
jgi:hypothetical protein